MSHVDIIKLSEFVIHYCNSEEIEISPLKLQKILYYIQAWHLVFFDDPLFGEAPEAWANGPVVREPYNHHRRMFIISNLVKGNAKNLNQAQQATIHAVVSFYGPKPSQYLSDLTHLEEPWRKARRGISDHIRSNREITLESMAEYYSSLQPEEKSSV